MSDYLFSINIAKVADYFFPTYGPRYEYQFQTLNKGFSDPKNIKPYSIIHLDTTYFFDSEIFSKIEVPFVLISNDSVYTIPYINYFDNNVHQATKCILDNPNLIKWFSINIDSNHPKLQLIPLGLPKHIPLINNCNENDFKDRKFVGWYTQALPENVVRYITELNINPKENIVKSEKSLLYLKFGSYNTQKTFHKFQNIRRTFIDKLADMNMVVDETITDWAQYMNNLKDYKFVLCLPGVGIDCYRTWESLTVGVIPIVLSTSINSIYEDLPVVIIDKPEDISEEFLNTQFDMIVQKIETYNWEKLNTSYWNNIIIKTRDDALALKNNI